MWLHKYKHKPSAAHNNKCILLMSLQAIWVVLLLWDRLSCSWLDSLRDLQSAGAWLSNGALVFSWDISCLIHVAPQSNKPTQHCSYKKGWGERETEQHPRSLGAQTQNRHILISAFCWPEQIVASSDSTLGS